MMTSSNNMECDEIDNFPLFGLNNCYINPKNLLSVIKFICLLFKIDFKVINPVFISTQIELW